MHVFRFEKLITPCSPTPAARKVCLPSTTQTMAVYRAVSLLLLVATVATATNNQCYDNCYERKRCDGFGHPSSKGRVRCHEKCERLCRYSENEKGTTTGERPIPDQMQSDGLAIDASSANLHVPVLVGNTTCCENTTSVTWPKNATFDSVNASLLTAKSISADEVTVTGGVHSKSTISSRIYTEDLASSGFISASTLVVKELGTFRGSINAKAVAAEAVEAEQLQVTQRLRSSTADVTGTLTAGKMEIRVNGEVVDLAKEIASLQQRVKDLEEVLLSSEGVKGCPKQEEEDG
mmetsp:Transcript_3412/g.7857  ORF Transcript_3412/g.7857 Transcript_3412/m.7857 type:complete len:292 (-) Transcript_3412:74-949(-)